MSTHAGSHAAVLLSLAVGDRVYRETTATRWAADMSRMSVPKSRRPAELLGREFRASLFTAVGSVAGDVRYLICVERVR